MLLRQKLLSDISTQSPQLELPSEFCFVAMATLAIGDSLEEGNFPAYEVDFPSPTLRFESLQSDFDHQRIYLDCFFNIIGFIRLVLQSQIMKIEEKDSLV